MRASRWVLAAVVVALLSAPLLSRWCARDTRQAIRVGEGRVVVTNLTGAAWSDVNVWLNDHYRAPASELLPGQRLEIPLDVFVAGFDRRFDRRRQTPAGVLVEARGARGARVELTCGTVRRR